MNIFYLDESPVLAAQMQCNSHVVKMILESAQMLSTAHQMTSLKEGFYRPTHINHPSNIWVRSSLSHYVWLYNHFIALSDEYTHRYGKVHKTFDKLANVLNVHPKGIEAKKFMPPPLAMPDEFKSDDPIQSYRNYYMSKQDKFKMSWTNRQPPEWFKFHADLQTS